VTTDEDPTTRELRLKQEQREREERELAQQG
jgi:hypothetical protein